MEVLRRRRGICDPQIAFGREQQEPFEPRARMLWPGALVTVWQQQREPRRLLPFRTSSGDELIDDDLSAVTKIPELCLPQHECVRRLCAVAIFETHGGV